jgi:hypothetical protein
MTAFPLHARAVLLHATNLLDPLLTYRWELSWTPGNGYFVKYSIDR